VDDRVWKNVSIVLGIVCAILIGIAGALMFVGKDDGSSVSSPDASLIAIDTASPGAETEMPTNGTPGSSDTTTPNDTPTAGPPGEAAPATITFNSMMLDSEKDGAATVRTFTFQTDAPGSVTWAVVKNSPKGTTRMCASVDQQKATCKIGGLMSLTGTSDATTAKPSTWTFSFVGYGTSAPTVDIQFTWPTTSPNISLTHGRLQGSSTEGVSEALNGFSATFKPRRAGSLNLQATWSTITADIDVSLFNASAPPAVGVDERPYSQANYLHPTYTYTVDPSKTYLLKLRNQSPDSGRPDLTAQISFP
jgi:hypothetical protein